MHNTVQSILINNNIPQEISWNIIKYLSHPTSKIIKNNFVNNPVYHYLDIRFDLFSPYCDKFNNKTIKHLINKCFKRDYSSFNKSYDNWIIEEHISSFDKKIWHYPINRIDHQLKKHYTDV